MTANGLSRDQGGPVSIVTGKVEEVADIGLEQVGGAAAGYQGGSAICRHQPAAYCLTPAAAAWWHAGTCRLAQPALKEVPGLTPWHAYARPTFITAG